MIIFSCQPPQEHEHVLSQSLSTESCSMSEYYDAEEFRESASESSSEVSFFFNVLGRAIEFVFLYTVH